MMVANKIVFALNRASHYREIIYTKINDELEADFYFGNWKRSTVKKFETSKLSNFKKEFPTYEIKGIYWQRGNAKLVFKGYHSIVLTGEVANITNWIILLLSKFTNTKVYFWTHGWYGKESKFRTLIKKIFYMNSYKVFLYGDYAKELMIKEGFAPEKLIPIYNSLDYDMQLLVRNKITKTAIFINYFKNENPVLIFIGRILKSKKLEQALDAMLLMKEKGVKTNFVIIGKEENGYNFEAIVYDRGLKQNVWLYGPCYDEDILGELIYNAQVCVSPGAIGLTAIHSLMYGTPTITHNDFSNQGPEFEAIKDGYNGAFFEKGNIEDLSIKIEQVIDANYPKEQCWEIVDKTWNPHNQIEIFKREFAQNK